MKKILFLLVFSSVLCELIFAVFASSLLILDNIQCIPQISTLLTSIALDFPQYHIASIYKGVVNSDSFSVHDFDILTLFPLDFEEFLEKNPGAKIYYATTKAPQTYTDVHYEEDCYIMFGKESAGIPEDILVNNQETCVRIPMIGDIRSLNLSNSVAIVLYEALRQNNFDHMNLEGHLRNYDWK